jgi:hypothetical protein
MLILHLARNRWLYYSLVSAICTPFANTMYMQRHAQALMRCNILVHVIPHVVTVIYCVKLH